MTRFKTPLSLVTYKWKYTERHYYDKRLEKQAYSVTQHCSSVDLAIYNISIQQRFIDTEILGERPKLWNFSYEQNG